MAKQTSRTMIEDDGCGPRPATASSARKGYRLPEVSAYGEYRWDEGIDRPKRLRRSKAAIKAARAKLYRKK